MGINLSAEFKLKVSATGPQTNVVVTDQMDENMTLDGDVQFTQMKPVQFLILVQLQII